MTLRWRTAEDSRVVHELLEESDHAAAVRTGTPVPRRRPETSRRLVADGVVRLGCLGLLPVVTVTVGPVPSFEADAAGLPHAERPWYMQRLAVRPDCPESLAGAAAVRHALERATAAGADALRAEANPDLPDVLAMLMALGATRHATCETGPARRTFLHWALRTAGTR